MRCCFQRERRRGGHEKKEGLESENGHDRVSAPLPQSVDRHGRGGDREHENWKRQQVRQNVAAMMDELGTYQDEIAVHVSRKETEKPDKYARVHEPGGETEDRGVDSSVG